MRDILLVIVETTVSERGQIFMTETWIQDYFLKPGLLDRSATVASEDMARPTGKLGDSLTEIGATACVDFVQFADGSTWGSPVKAKDALEQRKLNLDRLKSLVRIYKTQGTDAFLSALAQMSTLQVIEYLHREYTASSGDANVVVTLLNKILQNADLHDRAIVVSHK
jgi:hypothetical protein